MSLSYRPMRAGLAAGLGLAVTAMTGLLATAAAAIPAPAPARSAAAGYLALGDSRPAVRAASTGTYASSQMSVEVALAPAHQVLDPVLLFIVVHVQRPAQIYERST